MNNQEKKKRATKNKCKEKIKNENINASILGENAPFRVGLGANNLKSARNLRDRFITKLPYAWIF